MLDNDPSNTSDATQPGADLTTDAAPASAATKPAKKSAARKAPAKKAAAKTAKKAAAKAPVAESALDTVSTETASAQPVTETAAAEPRPAKKAPAKRAARKAAADAQLPLAADQPAEPPAAAELAAPVDSPAAGTGQPAKKPARKRAAKKAATAPAAADDTAADGAAPAMSAPGVLFVPPSEAVSAAPKTPRRRTKKASPAAEEPTPGEVDITAAEELEDETAEPEDVKEAAIEQASGARRRRRRGRRGRGGAAKSEAGDEAPAGESAEAQEAAETAGDEQGADGAGTHRRRRRRRSGEDDEAAGDEPGTVTHVREPKAADDGVKAVKGSTRLEAKRQRRKDGRETTRRRAPILSEAEFLARREAVDRVMAVRQTGERTQIAVLEDGILVEHYVTRASATSYVGNVYLGRVQNVLPSMEAAFVDIGKGRNGVLYAGEVNWDAAGLEGKSRAIESALKSGDAVLVQVTKDPIGHKGARLTSQVSLPGRFLVYVPGGGMTGISRRLPDTERHRLKSILKKIVPEDAGVIVRTAAEGASEEDLTRDVERLKAEWESIEAKAKQTKSAPILVHGEPDLATRVVRDVFNEDFGSLVVQGDDAWETVSEYIGGVAPDLAERMSRHTGARDVFAELRVDEQLMKALDRKVWLPSGGSLVIDRTEAMTVIDVNTGKFVGAGGNLEQTVTRNNLEAAEEIVRQLRLRDVGGIVVIDFIDMVLESNRELVLRRLIECLGRDRTKHQVAEVTSLGLVQMTRKRVGEGLLEAFSETCEVCKGRGVIVHTEPVDKAGGGAREDEERPAGRAKRKRGGRAAATEPEPPASVEQRKAASAAIAAIHKAAAGEQDEDGVLLLDDTELSDTELPDSLPHDAEPDETQPDGAALEAAANGGRELSGELTQPVHESQPDGAAAAHEPGPAPEPELVPARAPRPRRRRVASRPAGPPGAA